MGFSKRLVAAAALEAPSALVAAVAAAAPGADAREAPSALVAAVAAAAPGADACSAHLERTRGGKTTERLPEPERRHEKASGSDGFEPGTVGKGWIVAKVKPEHYAAVGPRVSLLLLLPWLTVAAAVAAVAVAGVAVAAAAVSVSTAQLCVPDAIRYGRLCSARCTCRLALQHGFGFLVLP